MRLLFLLPVAMLSAAAIEERTTANWPTRNHYRWTETTTAPAGTPVLATASLPAKFKSDSVRALGPSAAFIASKVVWHSPQLKVSFVSQGRGQYFVYFDVEGAGETERIPASAMVGSGDRITFGRLGVKGRLSVGLWAHP